MQTHNFEVKNGFSADKPNVTFIVAATGDEQDMQRLANLPELTPEDENLVFVTFFHNDPDHFISFIDKDDLRRHQQAVFDVSYFNGMQLFGYITVPNSDINVHVSDYIIQNISIESLLHGLTDLIDNEVDEIKDITVYFGTFGNKEKRSGAIAVKAIFDEIGENVVDANALITLH